MLLHVHTTCKHKHEYHLIRFLPLPPSHPLTSLPLSFAVTPSSCPCAVLLPIRAICRGGKGISCHISTLTLSFLRSQVVPGDINRAHACTKCIYMLICIWIHMRIKLSLKGHVSTLKDVIILAEMSIVGTVMQLCVCAKCINPF